VIQFNSSAATGLSATLSDYPNLVFEAHSTDYQTPENLRALVAQGFAILKVGPWLTFALREALYGLDAIADVLDGKTPENSVMRSMETVMQSNPKNWASYYSGSDDELWFQRHFSLSDRIRYYWGDPMAQQAVANLMDRLKGRTIPVPLLGQYLGGLGIKDDQPDAETVLIRSVQDVLTRYHRAITA
jgi:D-tagatose-1,6-bisphosphate aldolase subunit GatZ/KbaZ